MKNILIVEDDSDLLKLYKQVFLNANYQVKECDSLRKATETLLENKYDIILIDLLFPTADALSTIKNIRQRSSVNEKTPIMVLTNLARGEKPKTALKYGADKLLFKAHHTPKSIYEEVQDLLKDKQ